MGHLPLITSRRIGVVIAILVTLIGGTLGTSSSASAAGANTASKAEVAGKGSIAGKITGDGIALQGTQVYAYSPTGSGGGTTDANGSYRIDGLPVGTYTVCAQGNAEYKNGCTGQPGVGGTPDKVVVSDGATATADLQLIRAGSFAVTVVDPQGRPVPSATVDITASDDVLGTSIQTGLTDDKGIALVGPFEPGSTAWIHITPGSDTGLAPEWYQNAEKRTGAKPIVVPADTSKPTPIRVQLGAGATVRGRLTSTDGKPLAGATVTISGTQATQVGTTGGNGWYSISGLVGGTYTVRFDPQSGTNYVAEYFKDQFSETTATPYTVVSRSTQTLHAVLDNGATLSGVVTGKGVGVADIDVFARRAGPPDDTALLITAKTDAAGKYTLTGLGAGTYVVWATPAAGSGFATTYYGGAPSEATASTITVAAAATLTKYDIALGTPGGIAGVVKDSSGAPLAGAKVELRSNPYVGCDGGAACVVTAADGSYRFGAVNSTLNYLFVQPPDTRPDQLSEYYENVRVPDNAKNVTVGFVVDTIVNVQLDAGATVAGIITDEDGKPLAGVTVYAYGQDSYPAPVTTGPDGKYQFQGFQAGQATVYVQPIGVWSGGTATVSAVVGSVTTANFKLTRAATFRGKVADPAGLPIPDVCIVVGAYQTDQLFCQATTGADGTYEVTGQAAGDYAMCFSNPAYAIECHDNAASPQAATKITIGPGSTTTINAVLGKGGSAAIEVKRGTELVGEGHVVITAAGVSAPTSVTTIDDREMRPDGQIIAPRLLPGDYVAWYYEGYDSTTPLGKVAFTVTDANRTQAVIQLLAVPVVPSAPAAPTATTGNGSVTLKWAAPADGGSPIIRYVVEYRTAGGTWKAVTPAPTATTVTVSGLTNGTAYEFRVAAVNAVGQGLSSPITSVTPPIVVPSTTIPRPTTTTPTTTAPTTTAPTTAPTTTAPTTTAPTTAPTTTAPTTTATTTAPTTLAPTTLAPTTTAGPVVVTVAPDTGVPETGGGLGFLWPALLALFAGALLILAAQRRPA